ncbi:MBL fold metallo-hydrolase [Tepidibacillus marianensis]|uniref:MBL fold metallo-hydrolase n=1 Tax=Tepidibacillus marianensis TaxID=3131995 RepID=UPI0030CB7E30
MIEISLRKKENHHPVLSFEIPTPFSIGAVHSYILCGDRVTLVDTGPKTEKAWRSFVYQLNEKGLRIRDIDQIILTHQHVDHSGLLRTIKEHHPSVKVFAHSWTIPWIKREPNFIQQKLAFFQRLFSENGLSDNEILDVENFYYSLDQFMDSTPIDGVLEDGSNIEGLKNWNVIHSPGHSQGHIVLYNGKNRDLIAGDHIIGHTSAGAFIEPAISENEPRPKSVVDYRNSLLKIRKLSLNKIYSGHGAVIHNPYEVIDHQLERFERKKRQLESFLKQGNFSVYELMKLVYPNRYQKHLALYFAEVIGHLDLLEEEGKVILFKEQGIIRYQLV